MHCQYSARQVSACGPIRCLMHRESISAKEIPFHVPSYRWNSVLDLKEHVASSYYKHLLGQNKPRYDT